MSPIKQPCQLNFSFIISYIDNRHGFAVVMPNDTANTFVYYHTFYQCVFEWNRRRWAVNTDMNTLVICIKTLHLMHSSPLNTAMPFHFCFFNGLVCYSLFFFLLYCLYPNESMSFVIYVKFIYNIHLAVEMRGCPKIWTINTMLRLHSKFNFDSKRVCL